MITYFKDKNYTSKKKKNYKVLTTILKSFDAFAIFATTSSSITLSSTGIGFIVIKKSTGIACALTISNKITYEILMQKKIFTENNMIQINRRSNVLTKYIEIDYKIIYLMKKNMNLYVIFQLYLWMKRKMNDYETEKSFLFKIKELKFSPEPRS